MFNVISTAFKAKEIGYVESWHGEGFFSVEVEKCLDAVCPAYRDKNLRFYYVRDDDLGDGAESAG